MAPQYDPQVVAAIVRASRQAGVDPVLMTAVALEESGLDPRATGDQGSSFGLAQLHRGGALGNLTPQQAYDPYTNIGVVARSFAQVGGRGLAASPESLTRYYRDVGRGSSVAIPTQHAVNYLPLARQLVQQAGGAATTVPTVGAQPNATAASSTGAVGGGLSPALMAGLQQWLKTSSAAAAKGTYGGDLMGSPLFKQLLAARQQQNEVTPIGTPAAPPQAPAGTVNIGGLVYPLPKQANLIGRPYQGTHLDFGNWQSDRAWDFAADPNTPVYAVTGGTIDPRFGSLGSANPHLAGLRLTLDTPDNAYYYQHLKSFAPNIKPGAKVTAGQLLGYTGALNHLHFAARAGDPFGLPGLPAGR